MQSQPTRAARSALLLFALALAACDIVSFSAPAPAAPALAPTPAAATAPAAAAAPPASALLSQALALRANGDYDGAALALRALLDAHPNSAEARPAEFYLAESFALRARWTSAIEALRGFIERSPPEGAQADDDLGARALFWLARGYEEAGAWADAVAAYQRYRSLQTPLEPYARLREAAQQRALGQLDAAAQAYEAVAASTLPRGERAGSFERAIELRSQLGQPAAALALYTPLLELASLPEYRARILAQAAALAAAQGQPELARTWRRELATQLPASPQALEALAGLPDLEPAAAAAVYAAHQQWAAALPRYDAALAATSGDSALELQHQRALARRGAGDFPGALAELAAVGAAAPNAEVGRQAQLDWIQTLGQSGDTPAAITAYREYAAAYPDDPRAPEALLRAALLLERQGDAEGATQQRLDLGRRYPAGEQAHDALYTAGWALLNTNRPAEARAAWDLLRTNSSALTAAQAAFWAARTLEPQHPEAAPLLEATIVAAPDSYYAARAAELLGRQPAGGVPIESPISAEAWRAAEDWIAGWSGQPAFHLAEQGYPADVAGAPGLLRAPALEAVGLQPEAIAEWNELRTAWRDDPVKLYLLARRAHDQGVTYIALKAAEGIALRSPTQDIAGTPEALRRLIFPTPYASTLLAEAREHGVDPLALYALIRQESLFNPGATSSVGARGLAQVMPATAQGIAQNLAVPEFHERDLYRPALSIRFGAFYLGRQIDAMEGSLQAALAAYNGGPGNAQRWAGGASVPDPDRFTENIDFFETRNYVKLVYGYYGAYRRLYAAP